MNQKRSALFWLPRILSMVFISFLTMFSLDVFEPGLSFREILLGLIMHNIPSIIMILVLVIAWKWDLVGAISYFAVALIYLGLVTFNVINAELKWYLAISWSMTIAGPAALIGVLYLIGWLKKRSI